MQVWPTQKWVDIGCRDTATLTHNHKSKPMTVRPALSNPSLATVTKHSRCVDLWISPQVMTRCAWSCTKSYTPYTINSLEDGVFLFSLSKTKNKKFKEWIKQFLCLL